MCKTELEPLKKPACEVTKETPVGREKLKWGGGGGLPTGEKSQEEPGWGGHSLLTHLASVVKFRLKGKREAPGNLSEQTVIVVLQITAQHIYSTLAGKHLQSRQRGVYQYAGPKNER